MAIDVTDLPETESDGDALVLVDGVLARRSTAEFGGGGSDLTTQGAVAAAFPVGDFWERNDGFDYLTLGQIAPYLYGPDFIGLELIVADYATDEVLHSVTLDASDMNAAATWFFQNRSGGYLTADGYHPSNRLTNSIAIEAVDPTRPLRLRGSLMDAVAGWPPRKFVCGNLPFTSGTSEEVYHPETGEPLSRVVDILRASSPQKFFVKSRSAALTTTGTFFYDNATVGEVFPNGPVDFEVRTADTSAYLYDLDPQVGFMDACNQAFLGTPFQVRHTGYSFEISVDGGNGSMGVVCADAYSQSGRDAFLSVFYWEGPLEGTVIEPLFGGEFDTTAADVYVDAEEVGDVPAPLTRVLDKLKSPTFRGNLQAGGIRIPLPGVAAGNSDFATTADMGIAGPVDFVARRPGAPTLAITLQPTDPIRDTLNAAFAADGGFFYLFGGGQDEFGFESLPLSADPAFFPDSATKETTFIASIELGWLPEPRQRFDYVVGPSHLDAKHVSVQSAYATASVAYELAYLRSAVQYLLSKLP